jgi:hypothetical protein
MELSKARMRVNLLARDYFSEWRGIRSGTRKGTPLVDEGEGEGEVDSHIPLIGSAPHLHPFP